MALTHSGNEFDLHSSSALKLIMNLYEMQPTLEHTEEPKYASLAV
jgi:hypothetical protein